MPSAIGFIAVFGVAMLNGIVLVSFLNDWHRQGLSIREAVREGASLRLRPVLMTASVAILCLIPMLLSQGVGAEPAQQHYSMELAEAVVAEYRLELVCADDQADTLADVIAEAARTGQPETGWIFLSDIQRAVEIR